METIIKYELTINKAIRASLEHDTPDEQINAFIRFLGKEIGADRIYIFEDSQKENITNNTYEWCADGIKPEIDNLQDLSMDVIKWWYDCFEKGENIIIRNMEEIKEEYPDSYKLLRGQNIDRLVVSSFGSDREIRGFFGVDNPPESDFRGLTVFLDMIASLIVSLLKIRNKDIESKRMAQTDFMTGIWNRRHGEKHIEQALRDKVKGMMCIIDCDKFKSINDTYGHAVGDEVIIAIAHTLKNACRKDDIVMRLGGDEFAMFFPDATERQVTVEIFKRIFENIEKIEIKALGGRKIILSLGACIYDGTGDISYDTLYSKADAAMYRSKKQQGFCATVHGAADEVFIP